MNTPEAPPPPPPPPNAPTMANAMTQLAGARTASKRNEGVGSTLLTGGQGVMTPVQSGTKQLFGQ